MENFQTSSIRKSCSPSEYFREMRNVSEQVSSIIMQITKNICKQYPDLADDFCLYYFKRISSGKSLLRPFIFKAFLDLFGTDWERHLEMAAIIEMINISTYQSNLAFDNKYGVVNSYSKSNQFIASFFSKVSIFNRVIGMKQYSYEQREKIVSIMAKAYEDLYYGQYIDINKLKFDNPLLLNSNTVFNELYRKRCGLIGGSLIDMIAGISSVIANTTGNSLTSALHDFSFYFGLAGQVVNDLGDLSATGSTYKNKYSDLYNKKLTFPIRELILETNSLSEKILIAHVENIENLNRLKINTKQYIHADVIAMESSLILISEMAEDIDMLSTIGKLLTKSKFIN